MGLDSPLMDKIKKKFQVRQQVVGWAGRGRDGERRVGGCGQRERDNNRDTSRDMGRNTETQRRKWVGGGIERDGERRRLRERIREKITRQTESDKGVFERGPIESNRAGAKASESESEKKKGDAVGP